MTINKTTIETALGCISYVVLMVCRKRAAMVDPWMYALAGLFTLMLLLGSVIS